MSARVTAHPVGFDTLDGVEGLDALCVFVGEDERPLPGSAGFVDWRLSGRLSRLLKEGFFTGARGDSLLVPTEGAIGAPRMFAIGLGRAAELTEAELRRALAHAAEVLSRAGVEAVALDLPGEGILTDEARVAALQHSFLPAFHGHRVAVLGPPPLVARLGGRGPAGR
ncbi:MAG: peptidase M17 [Myxococcaceae bacterium]|nr:peptidase M17 [Myxococcaceae bacterium]MCI0672967.1 peptidase M17 [Myxococcaceae bacterium]